MHMGMHMHRERDLPSGTASHVFGLGGVRNRNHYGGGNLYGDGGRSAYGGGGYDRDAFQKPSLPAIGGGGGGAGGGHAGGGFGDVGGDVTGSWGGGHTLGVARGMRGGRFTSRGGGGGVGGGEDANLPSMQGGFWKHSPKGSSFDAFPTSTKPRTPYASSRPMTRESRPTTRERLDMVLDLRPPMTSHGGYGGHHHHAGDQHHGEEDHDEGGGWNPRDPPLKGAGGKALRPHLGGKQTNTSSRFHYRH